MVSFPRLKKETSFFSCWLLCNARYASPNSVPEQRYIWSRRTTHSVYGVLYSELLLLLCASVLPQFTLLRFLLVLLDEQQMLQQIQLLQLQEVMLNGNANVECASQWFLDFSESCELVVRLSTLSGDMKKTTVLNCDSLSVYRRLPLLFELPYGSSPRPPDDHTPYIHPSNSNEDLKI